MAVVGSSSDAEFLLQPGRLDLWLVRPEQGGDPALLDAYRRILTDDELAAAHRFVFERHRIQALVTRALQRTTLSRYLPISPQDWRFQKNGYGRPEPLLPPELSRLRFNLAHTDGLIACLVGLEEDFGVDVENLARSSDWSAIAHRFFSPQEVAQLRACPQESSLERFFDFWTLKEAYIKARGMGLSLPLDQFTFWLEAGMSPRITFDPRLEDDPDAWQFIRLRPDPGHKVAVACRRAPSQPLALRTFHGVPLEGFVRQDLSPVLEPSVV